MEGHPEGQGPIWPVDQDDGVVVELGRILFCFFVTVVWGRFWICLMKLSLLNGNLEWGDIFFQILVKFVELQISSLFLNSYVRNYVPGLNFAFIIYHLPFATKQLTGIIEPDPISF